jgi:ribose/xylose/arabinose/galactoside ABC-type transport system permease subunit
MAGVIQAARFASLDALPGEGMELQAVAVTVIGGALLSGGYGNAIGTMLGAVTFGVTQVGLVPVNVAAIRRAPKNGRAANNVSMRRIASRSLSLAARRFR